MNWFLEQSIDYANQHAYLDELFRVYPTIPNNIRNINQEIWNKVEVAYKEKNKRDLVENLLKLELFPMKDSYVAYLRKDKTALDRNQKTVERIALEVLDMQLDSIYQKCSEPKETNRQIGPMFKNWSTSGVLGFPVMEKDAFMSCSNDAILKADDNDMKAIAHELVGYNIDKGLDFVARIHQKYVIGEAKFLSDLGEHQNAQFNDAVHLFSSKAAAIKVAILDGVVYIKNKGKMYEQLMKHYKNQNVMSALLLRSFLYSI